MNDDLKRTEEARRERHWDPLARWQALQETIRWAESQLRVRRNLPAERLREQARKLAWLKERGEI